MNRYLLMIFPFLLHSTIGVAACLPGSLECMNTKLGILEQKTKHDSGDEYSYLTLNGKEIYKAKTSYMVINNDDGVFKGKKYLITKATISYVSPDPCYPDKPVSRCAMNAILDFTSGKPIISNEFFSGYAGGSRITWVSWGKANSIIVIDDELRFKYSNGHVERVTKVNDAAGDGSKDK